jgi:hypothetical protein
MLHLPNEGIDDAGRVFARNVDQHHIAGLPLNQSGNVTVLPAGYQVTFPMTRDRAIFHLSRSIPDRDCIDDLATRLTLGRCRLSATHNPPTAQMNHQLLLEHAAGLNEQALVDRLVGHAHCPVVTILGCQPTRYLLR